MSLTYTNNDKNLFGLIDPAVRPRPRSTIKNKHGPMTPQRPVKPKINFHSLALAKTAPATSLVSEIQSRTLSHILMSGFLTNSCSRAHLHESVFIHIRILGG